MKNRKTFYILGIIILIGIVAAGLEFFSTSYESNTKVTGFLFGNQVWSGEIYVTGDVAVLGDLMILPGTVIRFYVRDDQFKGDEVPADGFNDKDPTRLEIYTKTHSGLFVLKKLIAKGTPDQMIVFTSAAQKPDLADWEAIVFRGNGSIIENVIVEYTRNGINPIGEQPDSIIQNSISRHALWGAISAANSNIKIVNNHLSDAGHEGIDLKYDGHQEVSNNIIDDCHTGIASIAGAQIIKNNTITNCGDGVYIDPKSNATAVDNTFVPAPENSTRVWRYGDYEIPIFNSPEN